MAVAFFTTCGGPFGLEPLPAAVGPGWAVVLILTAPIFWSLPMALMVAELSTLMPEEGGYYVWVRETMGAFWGVQEAWWTMGYSIGLMASFPVLFVSYLSFFIPALAPGANAMHPGALCVGSLGSGRGVHLVCDGGEFARGARCRQLVEAQRRFRAGRVRADWWSHGWCAVLRRTMWWAS